MKFCKMILFFFWGAILVTLLWANAARADVAYRVWWCTTGDVQGSWCQGGPFHYIRTVSTFYDSYGCDDNFLGYSWGNNYQPCITHGGDFGSCANIMGQTIDHECFISDCPCPPGDGCGPRTIGDYPFGYVEDVRTQQMIDSGCCPLGFVRFHETMAGPRVMPPLETPLTQPQAISMKNQLISPFLPRAFPWNSEDPTTVCMLRMVG
jgi:hypothetical protein